MTYVRWKRRQNSLRVKVHFETEVQFSETDKTLYREIVNLLKF